MESLKKIKKKKKKNKPVKTTLNEKHKNKLENFDKNISNLPELEKSLKGLYKELTFLGDRPHSSLTKKELEYKYTILSDIKDLEKQINSIKSNKEYYDYLLESNFLLFEYNKIPYSDNKNKTVIDFFSSSKKKQTSSMVSPSKKKQIMNQFSKLTDKDFVPKMEIIRAENLDMCKTCKERRIIKQKKGVLICPKCGAMEKILVNNNTPSYKEPPREVTYFAYKKINHANEFLSQFQAKESTDIGDEIYNKILKELKKERYINIKNISADKIREILKKLELTKYYEHSHYIMNRLSGNPAPILDNILEDKLRNMFKQVQGPWLKYCPNKRANFFSYPYIFFKFFQLLEEDKYLPYCRLLKSREKLHEHDEVWKKICKELNWQFIPTV